MFVGSTGSGYQVHSRDAIVDTFVTNRPKRRRGRGKRFLIGLVIVLAVLWCGYWYAASWVARQGIERAVAALSIGGRKVTCTDGGIGGFPLTLNLHCTGAEVAAGSDHIAGGIGGASARALLYWPGDVEASLSGPLTIDAPALGGVLKASWTEASAHVDAGFRGLNGVSGTLSAFALDGTGDAAKFPLRHLAVKDASLATGGDAQGGYRVLASLHDLVVGGTDNRVLPTFSGDIAITAEKFGSALGLEPGKTIRAWVATGGAIRVDRLAFSAGPVSASATGALALSSAGLVSGTLVVRIVGLDTLADLAETLKPGSHDKVAQVVGGISAFTKPVADGSGAREINLVIQDGAIFAGMFPLPFVIPPVKL